MLDQHSLDRFFREIGIDGLTAEFVEVLERSQKVRISSPLFLDQVLDLLRELWDALGEFIDGL